MPQAGSGQAARGHGHCFHVRVEMGFFCFLAVVCSDALQENGS